MPLRDSPPETAFQVLEQAMLLKKTLEVLPSRTSLNLSLSVRAKLPHCN